MATSSEDAYREGLRLANYQAVNGTAIGLAVQISFLAVLGVGGSLVADGSLGIGALVAFLLYLFYLTDPIGSLVGGASQLATGLGALARIEEARALEVEDDRAGAPPPAEVPGADLVAFEEVVFRYAPDGPVVLDGVTLRIPEGGQTAVVGPSGAGKSTLFALIEGFYAPSGGQVLVAGTDVRDWPIAALRAMIGYVEQDAPVLAGTLRDNLAYAMPEADDGRLLDAAREAGLETLLLRLPGGLDGRIGSRGVTLSGGEAQRVAIARALARRPRLLLLDEATSQLDAINEQHLREAVVRAAERCTVIVIAHRLSTVLAADRIVVLDAGRVRAVGTHAELFGSDEVYRELATTQFLAAEPVGG